MWTQSSSVETVNGLAVSRAGAGSMALFIHRVGLRGASWNGLSSKLSSTHCCVTVDLPGHGQSQTMPPMIETIPKLSDHLRGSLSMKPDWIIGHSLGALIALHWAAKQGKTIKGVVALNGVFNRSEQARNAVMARADQMKKAPSIDPNPTLMRWFGNTSSPERTACNIWLTANRVANYHIAYNLFAQTYGADPRQIKRLKCPALFITGENDPNSTPGMSKAMADLAPRGQSHIVNGAAHMAPMTHAKEIAGQIKAFMDQER